MLRARRTRLPVARFVLSALLALLPSAAVAADLNRLMFVAKNGNNPSASDDKKIAMFQSWGYTVTVVDDGATQATVDAAAAVNDVTYVSISVGASAVHASNSPSARGHSMR